MKKFQHPPKEYHESVQLLNIKYDQLEKITKLFGLDEMAHKSSQKLGYADDIDIIARTQNEKK